MAPNRKQPENIALVLTDVDGTLVTHDKVLTRHAEEAVRKLHDRGIKFAITSGRPPKGMSMLFDALKLETPIAGFNGGQYAKTDLSIIEEHSLPEDVARKAVKLILDLGLDCWVYAGEDWCVRDAKAPHVERESWTVKFPPVVVDDLDARLGNAVKIVGVSDDLDLVKRAEEEMHKALGKAASAARSQPYYLDVTHPNANKGDVVAYLAKLYNISPGEIATLGDMPNDTEMFRPSGFAVAMGQASQEVKDQADFVSTSSEDEGFANGIARILEIGKPS
jgi:Cof subfamily protein (haloacid dehalogenase superfamily)